MKVLEISREDLLHNIEVIKKLNKVQEKGLKSPEIIAVVKGNAYGMGLVEYSRILIEQGIEFLAVSTVEEAEELRKKAREEKNWAESDRLRDEIIAKGYSVKDTKDGMIVG